MPERLTGGTYDNWRVYEGLSYPDGVELVGSNSSFVILLNCIVGRLLDGVPGPACTIRDGAHDILLKGGDYSGGLRNGDGMGGALWVGGLNYSDFDLRITVDGIKAHDSEVAGINAEGNAYRGYYITGLTVRNCEVYRIWGHPDEARWERTGVGIYVFTAYDCLFENNIVYNCTMSGGHEDCDTDHTPPIYPCRHNVWRGNQFWNAAMSLLEFEGSVGSEAHDNLFRGGAGWNWQTGKWEVYGNGMCFSWYARENIVSGNTFTDELGQYTGPVIDVRDDVGPDANTIEYNTVNIPFTEEDEDVAEFTLKELVLNERIVQVALESEETGEAYLIVRDVTNPANPVEAGAISVVDGKVTLGALAIP